MKVDASRDRQNQLEVDKAQNLYAQTQAQLDKQMRKSNQLPLVKEMIDEFRISLYAQQLGTKYPISLKRILG